MNNNPRHSTTEYLSIVFDAFNELLSNAALAGSVHPVYAIFLGKAVYQIDSGTYTEPAKMKLGKWLDIWTEEYLGDVKPSTAHLYSEDVRLYLKPALGAVPLEALDVHTIQKVYRDC